MCTDLTQEQFIKQSDDTNMEYTCTLCRTMDDDLIHCELEQDREGTYTYTPDNASQNNFIDHVDNTYTTLQAANCWSISSVCFFLVFLSFVAVVESLASLSSEICLLSSVLIADNSSQNNFIDHVDNTYTTDKRKDQFTIHMENQIINDNEETTRKFIVQNEAIRTDDNKHISDIPVITLFNELFLCKICTHFMYPHKAPCALDTVFVCYWFEAYRTSY
jgi:hypothetical protein